MAVDERATEHCAVQPIFCVTLTGRRIPSKCGSQRGFTRVRIEYASPWPQPF